MNPVKLETSPGHSITGLYDDPIMCITWRKFRFNVKFKFSTRSYITNEIGNEIGTISNNLNLLINGALK